MKVGDYVEYTGDATPAWRGRKGRVMSVEGDWVTVRFRVHGRLDVLRESLTVLTDVMNFDLPVANAAPVRTAGPRNPASLPEDSAERKTYPLSSGLLDYFPAALAAVAHHSYNGNEKHNPGQPLHWSRGKSADHLDAAVRHIMERDLEGAAWRILAALQMQLESEGAPLAIGARTPQGT